MRSCPTIRKISRTPKGQIELEGKCCKVTVDFVNDQAVIRNRYTSKWAILIAIIWIALLFVDRKEAAVIKNYVDDTLRAKSVIKNSPPTTMVMILGCILTALGLIFGVLMILPDFAGETFLLEFCLFCIIFGIVLIFIAVLGKKRTVAREKAAGIWIEKPKMKKGLRIAIIGAVAVVESDTVSEPTETELKLVQTAAAFLGKQLDN